MQDELNLFSVAPEGRRGPTGRSSGKIAFHLIGGRSFLQPNCPIMERVDSGGNELPVSGNTEAETGWSPIRGAVERHLHQAHDLPTYAAPISLTPSVGVGDKGGQRRGAERGRPRHPGGGL